MPLKVRPVSSKRRENRPIRRLYRTSFPKKERVPFGSMVRRARKPHVDFLSFYQDNDLAGMAYLFTWEDVLYLFYLALFVLCTAYLIHDTYNPFLYFRF